MKKKTNLEWPKWHNPPFPRLSGLLDGLLRKARVKSGPEGERLYGGRVRVQGERFKVYEAQVEKQLLAAVAPLQKEAGPLADVVRGAASLRTDTTGGSRQAARAGAARHRLMELNMDREGLISQADCTVEEALCRANTYLSLYTKASKFGVLEQEIPHLTRSRNFRQNTLLPGSEEKGGSV